MIDNWRPQGPTSGNFRGHSSHLDCQSRHHHTISLLHHSLHSASLGVNQQLAMANPGHSGSMQGRPTQGNSQTLFGRPIRPGNQPVARGTINPKDPVNAPRALSYPGLNQPVLSDFVVDLFSRQTPRYPYATGFYIQGPRAFNHQPKLAQPQKPEHQQQPQQQQQRQQLQKLQQVPTTAPPMVGQPLKSSGASRRTRSSDLLRIVDVSTNKDVLTGKKVPPSVVATPATSSAIAASGVVSAILVAADEVEAPLTAKATVFSETEEMAPTPSKNTNVSLIEKVKAKEKTVPTIDATPTPAVPSTVTAPVGPTPIIAAPVTQENGEVPSSRDPPNNNLMTTFLPINLPDNLKSIQPYLEMATDYASVDPCISYWCRLYALEQGFLLERKEENLPFLLDLMQVLGKNKNELQSKIETTDIPIARAYLQGVIQKLLNWAESAPPLVSFTDVVTKAFHTAKMLQDVCSIFGEPSEDQANKFTDLQGANLHSEFHSAVSESAKSTSLKPTCKAVTDQWSPVNLQGKKTYGRNFLLELQSSPACQKKPHGLASLEIVRDKAYTMKHSVSVTIFGDFPPPFVKKIPAKVYKDPNVWKPKHASKSKEQNSDITGTEAMLYKTVRGILNKLTPSNFEVLLARIQALEIDSEDRLARIIKLFYEKAVDEPIFSSMYAKMCQALLTKEVGSAANSVVTTNFRKLLLTRCQKEFEKVSAGLVDVENKKKEIESAETEAMKKELELELEDMVDSNQRRSLGNMRFIGELFQLRVLSVKVMHQCILRLLSQPEDEDSLECLFVLLSTIGKELETPVQTPGDKSTSISTSRDTMDAHFITLNAIVNERKISNRIRFAIQDLVDLRKTGWEKPRREDYRSSKHFLYHPPQLECLKHVSPQVPIAPPPTSQPLESSRASSRTRSSGLRIIDPNTNRDLLTGEEVPSSDTSVTATLLSFP